MIGSYSASQLGGGPVTQAVDTSSDSFLRIQARAAGAGPGHDLAFTDRVIATVVILRFQLPHAALAVFCGVHRSTITRAVHEVRPLLAARGFAVPGKGELRLRTLADVFAYAAAEGVQLRIDGTEVQVRRPQAGRPGRRAFVSGKKKQNTIKATVISDGSGRLLWAGAFRPGRMHDVTALRPEGAEDLLRQHPQVTAEVDCGYDFRDDYLGTFPSPGAAAPTPPVILGFPQQTTTSITLTWAASSTTYTRERHFILAPVALSS